MKAFVSWSGGKDFTFELHKHLQSSDIEVYTLLNMNRATTQNAHRITPALLNAQAEALAVKMTIETIEQGNDYKFHFSRVVNQLKAEGVSYGIFGDIYLQVHRDWIETTCKELGITPLFPLWGMGVKDIFVEFVSSGFVAKVIAVRNEDRFLPMLGENLSMEMYHDMLKHQDFDVCGENGEYHSFVVDAPIFSHSLTYKITGEYKDAKISALELDKQ